MTKKNKNPFTTLLPFQRVSISVWRRFWDATTDAHTQIGFDYYGPITWTGIAEADGTYLFQEDNGTEVFIHPEFGIGNYRVAEVYDLGGKRLIYSNVGP